MRGAHRDLAAIRALAEFALPLVERLCALPLRASWGEWLVALRDLAERAIAQPEAVLSILSELEIVRDVGPVSLDLRIAIAEREPIELAIAGMLRVHLGTSLSRSSNRASIRRTVRSEIRATSAAS